LALVLKDEMTLLWTSVAFVYSEIAFSPLPATSLSQEHEFLY